MTEPLALHTAEETLEAVHTRRHDAYPAYRPSGIEWLGDVPEHWEVKSLRYLGKAKIGLPFSPENLVSEGEGTLVLRAGNIQDGQITDADNVYVDIDVPDELLTRPKDILICSRSGSRSPS
jgi:type I restriction enzyme, S subunit